MTRNALFRWLAFVAAYSLLAMPSMQQRDTVTLSTLFWPPAGLLLAILMLTPAARWPTWMATAAALHIAAGIGIAGRSWEIAMAFAAGDFFLCGATAALWRWCMERHGIDTRNTGQPPKLTRLDGVLWFVALLAMNSILGGWLMVPALRAFAPATPSAHWYVWSMAAFVGCLVATPLVLAWSNWRWERLANQNLANLWLGLFAAFALLAGTTMVFNNPLSAWIWNGHPPADLTYGPLVFLALVSVTWGAAGTSLTVAGLALIAVSYTMSGMGPYGDAGTGQPLLAVQGYLGAAALLSLLMGALGADRERAVREATSWKTQLQTALRTSQHMAWEFFPANQQIRWMGDYPNPFGQACEPDTTLSRWLDFVHAGDREKVLAWVDTANQPYSRKRLRVRLRCADGQYHDVELSGSAIRDADGAVARVTGLLGPLADDAFR